MTDELVKWGTCARRPKTGCVRQAVAAAEFPVGRQIRDTTFQIVKMTMRNSGRNAGLAVLLTVGFLASAEADEAKSKEHPLTPVVRYAKLCLEKVEALPGYEATFYKREVVGRSTITQRMRLKIRHKPFSVYLYFEEPSAGREVIYVEGKNNGKLIAHEAGLLSIAGVMELSPTDALVMKENRYPITKAGIANTLRIMITEWEKEMKYGETEVKTFNNAKLGNLKCRVIETSHPRPRRQFNNHKIRLWVDASSGFPVRMQKYGFPRKAGEPAPIIEEYTFMNLKTDVRLSDADFDRNNSKYSF